MASKTIQALQILWTGTPTGDLPSGAYAATWTVDGTGYGGVAIRFSEDVLAGVTWGGVTLTDSPDPSCAPLIAQKGIAALGASYDGRRGGDMAAYEGVNVALVNAEQLLLNLSACGISLQGCPVQLTEYSGTPGAYVATTLFTGIADDLTWSATGLTVKCKNSRLRRNAAMFTLIDNGDFATVADLVAAVTENEVTCNYPYATDDENGKAVPITFGSLPFDGNPPGAPAKMLRTANAIIAFGYSGDGSTSKYVWSNTTNSNLFYLGYPSQIYAVYSYVNNYYPAEYQGVPNAPVQYTIQIGPNSGSTGWLDDVRDYYSGVSLLSLDGLVGQYMVIKSGATCVGQGRRIILASVNAATSPHQINLTLAAAFDNSDSGNSSSTPPPLLTTISGTSGGLTVSDTNIAWVSIESHYQQYTADVWPCVGAIE
jgi:hypothetical protein